jgi:Protein of unknown function (DUF3047)
VRTARRLTGALRNHALLVLCVLAAAGAAAAAPVEAIDDALQKTGWTLFSDSRWAPAHFRLRPDGAIEARSDNSTSLIWKKVDKGDAQKVRLAWEWRVDEMMPPTDITMKGGDDRPLALHVWFMKPRDQLSFLERLHADFVELWVGLPVHGRLLTYVWGGRGKTGDAMENPHVGDGSWMIVLRSGDARTGVWLAESRDLVADYRAAFGEDPPDRGIIALAADSEDTQTRSRAALRRLRFRP